MKQSRNVLHLGFLDIGLKNVITLLTSVSFLPAVQVLLTAASTAGVVASAEVKQHLGRQHLHYQRLKERDQWPMTEMEARKDGCSLHW